MKLAGNIRHFRKHRGMTQEQLAEVLGVTIGAVHKWETGMSTPELGLIAEMADFFDVSMDILVGYEMKDNRLDSIITGWIPLQPASHAVSTRKIRKA